MFVVVSDAGCVVMIGDGVCLLWLVMVGVVVVGNGGCFVVVHTHSRTHHH